MKIELKGAGLWGFGERFDKLNQAGLRRENRVWEVFTYQGADTYLPAPFCITNREGLYVNTFKCFNFQTEKTENGVAVTFPDGLEALRFYGTPAEILDQYTKLTGRPKLPPDWAFGLWISANRWNTQSLVEEQAAESIKLGMKPSVIVIEAWSDETTFYRFDKSRFPDPAGMVNRLHEKNIKVILWQAPVLKKLEPGVFDAVHEADCAEAVSKGYVALNPDKTPYLIPEGRWFTGSMIPDFTNLRAREWWFGKRRYLLEMGIDGFKTDGGEFVYDDGVLFSDGSTGAEMRNGYPPLYARAYREFIGGERVLFSRAGYTGSAAATMFWAGDQRSEWGELRSALTAGLNAALSGAPFWTFDIAGFAGEPPGAELYLRAFALACFSPAVQWHSEPPGGQFGGQAESGVNDRSPWNIAKLAAEPRVVEICRNLLMEREKLTPYIREQARLSAKTGRPMMAALAFDFPEDPEALAADDEYMFGEKFLVAPVLEKGAAGRNVYLPKGVWRDYRTGEIISGPCRLFKKCDLGEIPVWEIIP